MKIGKILLIIIFLIVCLFILTGCVETNAREERFIEIENYAYYTIFYDKETNVEYIMRNTGHGGSAYTVLVDQDGKPLLYNDN